MVGPALDSRHQCEAILRSVPQWFGIEEALVRYVSDTAALPTFAVEAEGSLEAFLTLREHFRRPGRCCLQLVKFIARR